MLVIFKTNKQTTLKTNKPKMKQETLNKPTNKPKTPNQTTKKAQTQQQTKNQTSKKNSQRGEGVTSLTD